MTKISQKNILDSFSPERKQEMAWTLGMLFERLGIAQGGQGTLACGRGGYPWAHLGSQEP